MFQVGDTGSFAIVPAPVDGTLIYSYVWEFWDGAVTANGTHFIERQFGQGGEPASGSNPRKLHVEAFPVYVDGQNGYYDCYVEVNNPPSVVPSPTISKNDTYFPYTSRLALTAYDIDRALPAGPAITPRWYNGDVLLSAGSGSGTIAVSGTWYGNGSVTVVECSGTELYFDYVVTENVTITCLLTDADGGETSVDFALRGKVAPPPMTTLFAEPSSLTTDASSLPEQRVGPGQSISFSAFAQDVTGIKPTFAWNFLSEYGWDVPEVFVDTAPVVQPDGSWKSVRVKDLTNEETINGVQKTSFVKCLVYNSNGTVEVPFYVDLYENVAPSSTTIKMYIVNGASEAEITKDDTVPVGSMLKFTAQTSDENNDVVSHGWAFYYSVGDVPIPLAPDLVYAGSTLNIAYGNSVVMNTLGLVAGNALKVKVIATDRLGKSLLTEQIGPVLSE